MPGVRTQHGRAEVGRVVVAGVLRSPRRLAAVVLALVAFVVGVGLVATGGPGSPSAVDTGPPGALESPAAVAPVGALVTARAFATQWASPELPADQWASRLHPYTAESYWPELATVDPANISSTRVTQDPRVVGLSSASTDVRGNPVNADRATIDVPTDAAILRLSLIRTPIGWRVLSYTQAG